ncbi:XRE family transcriptional regulator [Streptomyces sp. NPDC088739]|uniref:XRE family transcriptional regulator n=1 Tax=Streptomyces sp. NPDC088739 TaxID=3365882 RepID=UPI003804892E
MDEMTLRSFRAGRGLRQVDVAALLRVSQPRVAAIERHRVDGLLVGTVADYVAAAGGRLLIGAEVAGGVMVPLWWRPEGEFRT